VAPAGEADRLHLGDPANWELDEAKGVVVEQIIRRRPGFDPLVEIRPVGTQVDDLLAAIRERTKTGDRVLVTTSPSAWPRI